MSKKPLSFQSRVQWLDDIGYPVVPVPGEASEQLGTKTNRVLVRINGTEIRRSLQARKTGSPYLVVGKAVQRELGIQLGSELDATIKIDPEPDELDLAAELVEALAQDENAKERWDSFTVGKQRSLNHYGISAKREDTRIRRAVELATKIRTHTLYSDK